MLKNLLRRRNNNPAAAAAADGRGTYQPIPTTATESSDHDEIKTPTPPLLPSKINPNDPLAALRSGAAPVIARSTQPIVIRGNKKQRGCYLEVLVQILTMVGILFSAANIAMSLKTVTDGTIPGITVKMWLILVGVTAAWDFLVFFLMILLIWRTFRTENVLENGQREAYPDKWYAAYIESTGTAALVSCLTLTLILIYCYRYNFEEPLAASVYNIKDWEKPQQWVGAHYINISMRVVLLLRVYYRAFLYLGEPTLVVAGDAKLQ